MPSPATETHPLGAWLRKLFPGVSVKTYWTRHGIFVDDLIIPAEVQRKGLKGLAPEIAAYAKKYADYSGESIIGKVGPPEGYSTDRARLIKYYTRYGAAWDENRGWMVYPPRRANKRYEPLARGMEKYEGIL